MKTDFIAFVQLRMTAPSRNDHRATICHSPGWSSVGAITEHLPRNPSPRSRTRGEREMFLWWFNPGRRLADSPLSWAIINSSLQILSLACCARRTNTSVNEGGKIWELEL